MVAESWFRNLWKTSKKNEAGPQKVQIGVLAFEVASLMSKLIHLWRSLSDKQVAHLREEIANSKGIQKLVSEDDTYIVRLISMEMIECLRNVSLAVSRLSKRCTDPLLRSFERAYVDLRKIGSDPYGWQFSWKKMDRKIKKMERFVLINVNLYQEMETLADLEQTLKRMKGNDDMDSITVVEYEKRVAFKKQEVKNLKEISLWNRSYDYTILLLARSLFTVFNRIGYVFGIDNFVDSAEVDRGDIDSDHVRLSHSVVFTSTVPSSQSRNAEFFSGPLGNVKTYSNMMPKMKNANHFYSGPLASSAATVNPIIGKDSKVSSYSGPLGGSTVKSGPIAKAKKKSTLRFWKSRDQSANLPERSPAWKSNGMASAEPLKGGTTAGIGSLMGNARLNTDSVLSGSLSGNKNFSQEQGACKNLISSSLTIFTSKSRLLNAPPGTLGSAALALHYANIIIVIEKLVASPHLIGHDAREDLYNMLPATIRSALREKLMPHSKSLISADDSELAEEWNGALSGILEWLAPLAHNMIRWQSERSFEQQNFVSKTNVLLVQTLYFANQEKTEATITELLLGLNYVWRFNRELNAKAVMECASGRTFDGYLDG